MIDSTKTTRPYADSLERLRNAGLRPTRQRLALAKLLFSDGDRHVTAEKLHAEAQMARVAVSLATVYNTLHQFTDAGLLQEIVIDPQRSYFDTNMSRHHHFFHEETGTLLDIPGEQVTLACHPDLPDGTEIDRIDVVFRIRGAAA